MVRDSVLSTGTGPARRIGSLLTVSTKGVSMWARVARFDGDPADIDARIERLRPVLESPPAGLEGARFLLLVDRASGNAIGLALFDTEEAMRKGDAVMNAGPGHAGSRAAVEFYEVPLHTL